MLCKIFLHLCEVFLTFFVHNCDLRAECLYIFCCAKDSCKMLFSCTYGNVYKTFCYFLSSIALVLFACQWGENKEGKSLEQPLEMLLKMIGGEVVGGVPPPLAWSWWGLEREKVKPHYPPSRGFFFGSDNQDVMSEAFWIFHILFVCVRFCLYVAFEHRGSLCNPLPGLELHNKTRLTSNSEIYLPLLLRCWDQRYEPLCWHMDYFSSS